MSAAGFARQYAGHAAGDSPSTEPGKSQRWQRQSKACWGSVPTCRQHLLDAAALRLQLAALAPLILCLICDGRAAALAAGPAPVFLRKPPPPEAAAEVSWTARALSLYKLKVDGSQPIQGLWCLAHLINSAKYSSRGCASCSCPDS